MEYRIIINSPPLSNDNGGEIQEREVRSKEEKEDLSGHYVTKQIWRNYQEIVDNHRKMLIN